MSRYIDADMLLRILDTDAEYNKDNPQRVDGIIDAVQEIIAMPTSDVVEVKHGRWIKDRLCSTSGGTYGVRRCSVCEYYFQDFINEYNYCPNCGADMRGEDDE